MRRTTARGVDGPEAAGQVADLSAFLVAHPASNPDFADFEPDGTWYSVVSADGVLYAVEPNRQEIDTVTPDGHVSRLIDMSRTFLGTTERGPPRWAGLRARSVHRLFRAGAVRPARSCASNFAGLSTTRLAEAGSDADPDHNARSFSGRRA